MTLEMVTDIIIFIASLVSFIYGFFKILIQKKKALYLKMIVLAIAGIMISRANIMLQYLTRGAENQDFHVGLLGLVGCFLFLLSANYGEMDRLVDDGSKEFFKYRMLSWIAPVILLVIFSLVFLGGASFSRSRTIMCSVVMLVLAVASRFHLKHYIFPDAEYGVVRRIRGYNAVALVLCLAATVLLMADVTGNSYMYFGAGIVMAIGCLILLPLLQREVAKWTTI